MPRLNKKTTALEAALDIIAAEDVSGLTYDSLAQATGMSKSGLIYHFPTRHDLLVDCHRFCAARWETELERLAGGHPASELSWAERSRALVLSMGKNDPLIQLLMCVHSQTHPDFSAQWAEVDARWMVDPSAAETDEDDLLVMLLSTGLWVHDHLNQRKLSPANRQRMVDRLFRLIDAPSKPPKARPTPGPSLLLSWRRDLNSQPTLRLQ